MGDQFLLDFFSLSLVGEGPLSMSVPSLAEIDASIKNLTAKKRLTQF